MSTGRQSSAVISITIDDAAGVPRTLTRGVMTLGGAELSSDVEVADAFGFGWAEKAPSGHQSVSDITLEGFFNTSAAVAAPSASGTHVVLSALDSDPNAATRTVTLGFGDSKTLSGEAYLTKYAPKANQGKLTGFSSVLSPTGAWVWA